MAKIDKLPLKIRMLGNHISHAESETEVDQLLNNIDFHKKVANAAAHESNLSGLTTPRIIDA